MPTTYSLPPAFPFHVMAKPIGPQCNLDCTYCYYLEKKRLYPDERKFRMDDVTLERFISDYIASQDTAGLDEIWFTWQGGEPNNGRASCAATTSSSA